MKEDIEIINKYIELINKGYCEDCNELNCIDNFPHKKIAQALENLIARIKELEDIDLTTVYLNGIYEERDKWKEKIKGKIEEINKAYEDSKDENGESEYYYPDYTIEKLEELLQ